MCRWMGSHFHDWIDYIYIWGCILNRVTRMGSQMGHFRVAVCLGFEVSLGAQLLKGK